VKWLRTIKTNRGRLDLGDLDIVRRRFGRYLRPFWKQMLVAMAATGGAVLMNVASPWPIKFVFDIVLSDAMSDTTVGRWFASVAPSPTAALVVVCGCILFIASGIALFSYVRDVLLAQTGQQVVGQLRHDMFRHMQMLSPDVFETKRTGDLLLRLTGDMQMLRQMLVNAWVTFGENALTIVVTVAVMFWLNPFLAMFAVATIPAVVWSAARISKRIRKATKSQREKESNVASIAHEVLGAIMVVQAFNREKIELQRFSRQNRSSIRAGVRTTRLEAKLFRTVSLASAVGLCAVLYFGVSAVLAGTMTAGDLLVFVAYVRALNKPIRKMTRLAGQSAKATACGLRIAEILSIQPNVKDSPDSVEAEGIEGRVVLDGVSFDYPDGTRALDDVSFSIEAKECVAIVGRSGAGKSTIIKLLSRFYDVDRGAIRIDDLDIREIKVASLRNQFAVVQQGTVVFGFSVAENIALGCEEVDIAEVRKAAKSAGADEFIRALPNGYRTVLSERGTKLSGGERQRLALARAFLRKSPILILDEPGTGLDAGLEHSTETDLVFEGIERTRIVICHDFATMQRFDRVIVLDNGRVVADGDHASLVQSSSSYQKLYFAWQSRQRGRSIQPDDIDASESERLAC
jgi:ATP-binding cassette, subfamily B, bacterial